MSMEVCKFLEVDRNEHEICNSVDEWRWTWLITWIGHKSQSKKNYEAESQNMKRSIVYSQNFVSPELDACITSHYWSIYAKYINPFALFATCFYNLSGYSQGLLSV